MEDDTLLSDLCNSCNIHKPKYRCPGCAARTCSLPCYKRHQQRAQCTGKRDPTKFMKKSQLATPAGIDHDFNFLTGVERDLAKAEKEVQDRALGAVDDIRIPPPKGSVTERRLTDAGVHVIRAPKGLSRQRDNKTRMSSKRKIIWSVEWIHEDKSRQVSEASENQPIGEAYRTLVGQHSQNSSKKRKRDAQETKQEVQDAPAMDKSRLGISPHDEGTKPSSASRQPSPERIPEPSHEPESDTKMADAAPSSTHVDGPEPKPVPPQHHFFLLKPRTTGNRNVLIPLTASSTLSQSLRNRTVLEFPTIYVFSTSPPPPEDFMLEDEYLKVAGEESKELDDILRDHPEALQAIKDGDIDEGQGESIDSEKVLDVLKQDLGALSQPTT